MFFRSFAVAVATVSMMALAGCATRATRVDAQWVNPEFAGQRSVRSVMVMAAIRDSTSRRNFEDRMVAALSSAGVKATPSYRFIPADGPVTEDQLRRAIADAGAGHALISRIINVSTEVNVTPGMVMGPTWTPVLVLTALGEVERRVEGLDAGADDYLAKPFAFSELRARIAALARRPTPTSDPVLLQVGDIEMDLLKRVVRRNGQPVELLPTEMRLLEFMLRRPGQVLTKTMLLEGVWDLNFDPSTNLVEVHVSRLRRKLSLEGLPAPIQTMRGVGYMLGAPT